MELLSKEIFKMRQYLYFLVAILAFYVNCHAGLRAETFPPVVEGKIHRIELRLSQDRVKRGEKIEVVALLFDINDNLITTKQNGDLIVDNQSRKIYFEQGLSVIDITTDFILVERPTIYVKVAGVNSNRKDFFVSPAFDNQVEIGTLVGWQLKEFSVNRSFLELNRPEMIQDGVTAQLYANSGDNTFSLFNLKKHGTSLSLDTLTYELIGTMDATLSVSGSTISLPKLDVEKINVELAKPEISLIDFETYVLIEFSNLHANDGGNVPDGILASLVVEHNQEILLFSAQTYNGVLKFDFLPKLFSGKQVLLKIGNSIVRYKVE